MMAQLKIYYDLMSQPCRTVYLFCKLNRIQFTACTVALRRMEHKSPDFLANVNPFGLVPVLDHDGFLLMESVAIVTYLASQFGTADHWYPGETRPRARVDEYLSWHQLNTRLDCASYFRAKWLLPLVTGQAADPSRLAQLEAKMCHTLDHLDSIWLKERPFLAGDHISIADLFAVCELEQPLMVHYDVFDKRSRLSKWYSEVRQLCAPFYDETHAVCHRIKHKNASKI